MEVKGEYIPAYSRGPLHLPPPPYSNHSLKAIPSIKEC